MAEHRPQCKFPECKHISRTFPDETLTDELVTRITNDCRVIPEYSKTIFENIYFHHYSLQKNDFLKCRWDQFRERWRHRVKQPIYLPDRSDEHFYCQNSVRRPEESVFRRKDFRMKLKPGPGVDSVGHIPPPDEFMIKRGFPKKHQKGEKLKTKTEKTVENSSLTRENKCPCKTETRGKNTNASKVSDTKKPRENPKGNKLIKPK